MSLFLLLIIFVHLDFAAKYAKHPYGSLGKKGMVAVLTAAIFLFLLLAITFVYWFIKARRQGKLNYFFYQTWCS